MKNLKFFTLAIAILGFTATSFAQTQNLSATANAGATIIAPLIISTSGDGLQFGNIAVGVGGSVVLSTAGTRTASGVNLPTNTGTFGAADFNLKGESGAAINILLPTTVTLKSGGNTMDVTDFKHNIGGTDDVTISALSLGSASVDFKVGGKLTVADDQAAGTYTNTTNFTITVAYQ